MEVLWRNFNSGDGFVVTDTECSETVLSQEIFCLLNLPQFLRSDGRPIREA